ncbi:hypothetical protein ACIQNI_07290 [Streptomyces sp. NPDC091266]|uniref:hypothetical protein n=1 Tax=Streptomyces sp. NPDC091266 TaxID=3365978 RepID=UPI0038155221
MSMVRKTQVPECPIRKPSVVPYVVLWSGEQAGPEDDLVVQLGSGGPRLGYRNERPEDRAGSDQVLCGRVEQAWGSGRPLYDSLHVGRQYVAMYSMKCQVCGQPASRNKDGWLFLDWRKPHDPPTWPEGSLTGMPPLCEAHARVSIAECPYLRDTEFVVLRVRTPRLWGFSGTPYTLTADGWKTHECDALLPIGDQNLRGLLASRLYRELRNVTVVGGGLAD